MVPPISETIEAKVARYFGTLNWQFVENNPSALGMMQERIVKVIEGRGLITYVDLADDLVFYGLKNDLSTPYQIHNWKSQDGSMVGDFLCYLSMQSFLERGCLDSAVVINSSGKPSPGFFELAKLLGLLARIDRATDNKFWRQEKEYVYALRGGNGREIPFGCEEV